jgi:hypothetical protein
MACHEGNLPPMVMGKRSFLSTTNISMGHA